MNTKELVIKTEAELSKLSDQELLEESKKLKSFSIFNAFLVGFLIGILVFSLAVSSWGFLTLIPLFLINKIVNDPKNLRSGILDKLIKERKLK